MDLELGTRTWERSQHEEITERVQFALKTTLDPSPVPRTIEHVVLEANQDLPHVIYSPVDLANSHWPISKCINEIFLFRYHAPPISIALI